MRNVQARKFAKAMKAPLVFTSATHSVNVQKLFKVVLAKVKLSFWNVAPQDSLSVECRLMLTLFAPTYALPLCGWATRYLTYAAH